MRKPRASSFSFPFYPSDHMNDLNLRGCHPAAQGIWVSMFCLMAQGSPFGHLRIEPGTKESPEPPPGARPGGVPSGGPHTRPRGVPGGGVRGDTTPPMSGVWKLSKNGSLEPELFRLIGQPEDVTRWAIEHLESRGVFSRTADGIIFSRRMVRQAEERAARVKRAQEAYKRRQQRERSQSSSPPSAPGVARPGGTGRSGPSGTAHGGPRGVPTATAPARPNGTPRGVPTGAPLPPPTTNTPTPTPPRKRGGPQIDQAAVADRIRRRQA